MTSVRCRQVNWWWLAIYLQQLLDVPHVAFLRRTSSHIEVELAWINMGGALLNDDLKETQLAPPTFHSFLLGNGAHLLDLNTVT